MAKKTAEVKNKIAELDKMIAEKQELFDLQKDLFVDAKQEQLTKLSKLDKFDEDVIRNIIAAVRAGRRIERREPDAVNAELLQIVELLQYPPQIADPVAVSVAEAPGPDLIKNHVLKPSCMTHIHFSPCRSLVSITTIFY